jgi:hypothetical protein
MPGAVWTRPSKPSWEVVFERLNLHGEERLWRLGTGVIVGEAVTVFEATTHQGVSLTPWEQAR